MKFDSLSLQTNVMVVVLARVGISCFKLRQIAVLQSILCF
jgi:hypothetical protein